MLQNYSQLVERIAKSSGLSADEIERRIEAKRAKLSGLISKEGAAQVVASELGISFEKEKMKISELLLGMRKVNVVGKIIQMFPVREFNKDGRQGKIGSFVLADDTSNIKTVLWDVNHIALIEKSTLKMGDVVEINNGTIRNNEMHLTGFSDIKLSKEIISKVFDSSVVQEKMIKELNQGENVGVRAFIVQIFEPRFFTVCPSCRKKVNESGECAVHGKVIGEKRALLSIVLDDGSETIRAVLFSDPLNKVINNNELEGDFARKKSELLGKEMEFMGNVRRNQLYDNLEFFVNDWKDINVDTLIEKLEKQ